MVQLVVELIFSVAVNGVVVVPGDSVLHSVINSPLHTATLITCDHEVSVD